MSFHDRHPPFKTGTERIEAAERAAFYRALAQTEAVIEKRRAYEARRRAAAEAEANGSAALVRHCAIKPTDQWPKSVVETQKAVNEHVLSSDPDSDPWDTRSGRYSSPTAFPEPW